MSDGWKGFLSKVIDLLRAPSLNYLSTQECLAMPWQRQTPYHIKVNSWMPTNHQCNWLSLLSQGKQQGPPPRFNCLLISFIEFNTRANRKSCALSNIDGCQRQTSNCSAVSNTAIYLMHWVWLLPLDRIQFWQTRTGFLCIALSTIHCWLTYLDAHIMYIVKTYLDANIM